MQNQAFSLWKVAASLCGTGLIAVFAYPIYVQYKQNQPHPASCQSNLKQIALSIKQYIQDYDEAFPQVSAGGQGWSDVIRPYLGNQENLKWQNVFRCPVAKSDGAENTVDYFYNTRLGTRVVLKGAKLKTPVVEAQIEYSSSTIMNGDGIAGGGPNSSQSSVSTINGPDSPALRHLGEGAFYSFVDGHVKWLKPNRISSKSPGNQDVGATFAIN